MTVTPVTTHHYEVVAGDPACDHIGSQILSYDSPVGSHRVWSCPKCHRIVRHDWEYFFGSKKYWTTPEVAVPKGLEGVETADGRQWKMPNAEPLPKKRKRFGMKN